MAWDWVKGCVEGFLSWGEAIVSRLRFEGVQKRRLRRMLSDKRFPKGFRSTGQLMNGIGADKAATERLLLQMGARKSEVSDEWTLRTKGG